MNIVAQAQQKREVLVADSSHLLVRTEFNWADEIDFRGFRLYAQVEWQQFVATARAARYPQWQCVGSNEDVEWGSADQFLDCFTPEPLTAEEYTVLAKFFPSGMGNVPELSEEDDEDSDE